MMIFTMILQIITTTLMAIHGEARPSPKMHIAYCNAWVVVLFYNNFVGLLAF